MRSIRAFQGLGILVLLGALAALSHSPVAADGDPLEEYDFTGEKPVESFTHQSRSQTYQHGLWTVQRHVELDPFTGQQWALEGNRSERINVYYGTRPLWCSDKTYRIAFGTPAFGPHHENAPRFEAVQETVTDWYGKDPEIRAIDYTDRGGVTLLLSAWNGGANDGSSASLIHLAGDEPASARVEVLWSGQYQVLRDLDADGEPEIIDTDRAHHYASYLPHKGIIGQVVLDWDATRGAYVVANDRFYSLALRELMSEKDRDSWDDDRWLELRIQRVKAAVAALDPEADPQTLEHQRSDALRLLASTLLDALWSGHVDEAVALFREAPLPYYGGDVWPATSTERRLTADEWWKAFIEGCRKSEYWPGLCDCFPRLRDLR